MQRVRNALSRLIYMTLLILVVGGVAVFLVQNYGYVFAKKVTGQILEIERVTDPGAIIGGARLTPEQLYSFAVAIRAVNEGGRIYTASSEDRQWAVARKGLCVEAEFYPYPPWNFQKRGTYHNARMVQLMDCPPGAAAAAGSGPVPGTAPELAPGGAATAAPAASPSAAPEPVPAAPARKKAE